MALRERLARLIGGKALAAPEVRQTPGYGPSFASDYVTPYSGSATYAENLSAVLACVSAISSAISALPPLVYRQDGSRRVEAPDHWLARLVKAPNHLQSWPDFCEWMVASFLLYGNAIADPQFDGRGVVTALSPVPFWQAQPILVPANPNESLGPQAPSARLAFDMMRLVAPWGGTGTPRRLFADECLFVRDRSDTGILGRSRLSRCPMVLASALGAQEFSASMWNNQAVPPLSLQTPGQLSKEAADRIAQSWKDTHQGPANARRVVILEEGLTANPLNLSAEDNQLLESRRFSVQEIARIYDCPPPMIGDWEHATFSNTSTAMQWWGSKTLLPIVNKIEREFSRSIILDDSVSLHLDLSNMLRGDFVQRTQASVMMVRSGILTPNEAREIEGFNPMDGGDTLQPQSVGGAPGQNLDGEPPAPPSADPTLPAPKLNGSGKPANGAAA